MSCRVFTPKIRELHKNYPGFTRSELLDHINTFYAKKVLNKEMTEEEVYNMEPSLEEFDYYLEEVGELEKAVRERAFYRPYDIDGKIIYNDINGFFVYADDNSKKYLSDTDPELNKQLIHNLFDPKEVNSYSTYDFRNYKPIKLKRKFDFNKEQQEAIDGISDHIAKALGSRTSTKPTFITLQGAAGTGKTTIIDEIIEKASEKLGGKRLNVSIAALSHKAKDVLMSKTSRYTKYNNNVKGYAIAGFLGEKKGYENGEVVFKNIGNKKAPVKNAELVFIDEASMVNERVLDKLIKESPQNAVYIFIGDSAQLPPIRAQEGFEKLYPDVKETDDSPVFNLNAPKYVLRERVRQGEGNPILDIAEIYRDFTEGKRDNYPNTGEVSSSDKVQIVSKLDINSLAEEFAQGLKDENPSHIRIVAYKNDTVQYYNTVIHQQFKPKGGNDYIAYKGEPITLYSPFMEGEIPIAQNSEDAIVLDTDGVIHKDNFGFEFYYAQLKFDSGLKGMYPILVPSPSNEGRKQAILQVLLDKFKGDKNEAKKVLDNHLGNYIDAKLSYAITTHKAQGSTYDISVVDVSDINGVQSISDKTKSQSIYTAITRASDRVILRDLHSKGIPSTPVKMPPAKKVVLTNTSTATGTGTDTSNEQKPFSFKNLMDVTDISSPDYSTRTKKNIDSSDVTIALASNFDIPGERLTARLASEAHKYTKGNIDNDDLSANAAKETANKLIAQFKNMGFTSGVVNIAGNGLYDFPLNVSQEQLDEYVKEVIRNIINKGFKITGIRSGGQTGVDEAGIKAAIKLGIPYQMAITKDFAYIERSNTGGRVYHSIKGGFNPMGFFQRFLPKGMNASEEYQKWAASVSDTSDRGKDETKGGAVTGTNNYEVSTAGDKRFSALNATFKQGTVFEGVDVGGYTIEEVYQTLVKQGELSHTPETGKGKPPVDDSILVFDAVRGDDKYLNAYPVELQDAIRKDFTGDKRATKRQLEDYSYYRAYKPLWELWASQNPELIEDLRKKSAGKTLTDKFSTETSVTQARALTDILKETSSKKGDPQDDPNVDYVFTENAELSNLASRPFKIKTLEGEHSDDVTTFDNVEQAFQYHKFMFYKVYATIAAGKSKEYIKSIDEHIEKIKNAKNGYEAKKLGKEFNIEKEFFDKVWSEKSTSVMTELVTESFLQNYDAGTLLLKTGNAKLTHNQDKSVWGTAFPRALMAARAAVKFDRIERGYYREQVSIKDSDLLDPNFFEQKTFDRSEAEKDAKTLYISTDNIEDIDNVMPISIQRFYRRGAEVDAGRWTDDDASEFQEVIMQEIDDIIKEFNTGKYENIVVGGGFFANITKEKTPELHKVLRENIAYLNAEIAKIKANSKVDSKKTEVAKGTVEQQKEPTKNPIDKLLEIQKARKAAQKQAKEQKEVHATDYKGEPIVSSVEEQEAVDLAFDPKTRRDRVVLLARLFSEEIDKVEAEYKEYLKNRALESDPSLQDEESISAKMDEIRKEDEEENKEIKDRISRSVSEEEKRSLKAALNNVDRRTIIAKFTPAGIFERAIKNNIQNYLDNNNYKVLYMNEARALHRKFPNAPQEKILSAAKNLLDKKRDAFQKIIEHQKPLIEETSSILLFTEGIRIDPNFKTPINDKAKEEEGSDPEESQKEHWMTSFRETSSHDSLSQEVRKLLYTIPKVNYKGKFETDDLGFIRYLDPSFAHSSLMDKLRLMTSDSDLMPMLKELAESKKWVKGIISKISKDDSLKSKFYQDFRKDFIYYYIQTKTINADGVEEWKTVSVNKPEGIGYLLDSWRDSIDSGDLLDDHSIYKKDGTIDKMSAQYGLSEVQRLQAIFNNKFESDGAEIIKNNPEIADALISAMKMVGINTDPVVINNALTFIHSDGLYYSAASRILTHLNEIFSGIVAGKYNQTVDENGIEQRVDLLEEFTGSYSKIAEVISTVDDGAIEQSIRENGKTYYGHVMPSYLGKLIKNMKNPNKFEKYIAEQYQKYPWFFREGTWLNSFIEELSSKESSEMRDILDHKVLLNSDKLEYTDWDSLDYMVALINEYKSDPKEKTAWYHVPILSDAPSAEFIRMRRIKNGTKRYKVGDSRGAAYSEMPFDDAIVDEFVNVVKQEFNRINTVNARAIPIQQGLIEALANYDISYDSRGNIKSRGGSEFKFLPRLNKKVYEDGTTFYDKLVSLLKNQNSTWEESVINFIRDAVKEVMEEDFEEAYEDFVNKGLLDETKNGKLVHISGIQGSSAANKNAAVALEEFKNIAPGVFTTEMQHMLRRLKNNKAYSTANLNKIIKVVETTLQDMVKNGTIKSEKMNVILNNLEVKNAAKELLREYYYNSSLATCNIIQMTTTDLAFYKNMEDFQKRYKEVHAPALRLNTHSKYGREFEKTLLLADSEIVSNSAKEIANVILEKHKNGELTDYEAADILSKFGYSNEEVDGKKYVRVGKVKVKSSKVNVADAQAYRSLNSYKAILDMAGKWNDNMERAFNNLLNGKWDANDFNIIWQTIKPYVFTQVGKDSGVGDGDIKVPIQHKNSEFLLLVAHSIVAGKMGKGNKLRAINDFMQEKGIDVIQFESTTKVGKQGVIDLSGIGEKEDNCYQKTLKELEDKTGIKANGELGNQDVVHVIPYEDYGIQTATPEHVIDAIQLIGTQIRKLIAADISEDVIIEVDGVKKTKKEWMNLYNEINTENIIDSFKEINAIFSDPKEIEKVLLEEVRSSSKYGPEMIRAVTLGENGKFNIPLFDPVISRSVQQLLNSIIKSRVTKQKIRGGACIQVSNFGYTDELNIVFKNKDGKILSYDNFEKECKKQGRKATKEGFEKWKELHSKEGELSIAYLECYMPAYSKEFYEKLMKPGTHELDINALPEDLRKLIGYRVPTEDKYSMAPLYIKGFLPQQNGSAIMLPSEITTLSGSDFDVDKLYVMLPEFSISEYDMKAARENYAKENEEFNKFLSAFSNSQLAQDLSDTEPESFKDWFAENKEKFKREKAKIYKVRYNQSKPASEQSREARNNGIIDLMWGVLTNKDTTSKILNPGGFDPQKKTARIIELLNNNDVAELTEILKERKINTSKGIVAALSALELSELEDLASSFKKAINPLSPTTQVYFHNQNMTGGKLIGVYANHNVNHALLQTLHAHAAGVEKLSIFRSLGGSLSNIKNKDGEFISRVIAGFLAASVDNVKDPVLAFLNQNLFTADPSMLLARLGCSALEIGMFMSQPIIKEITEEYFRRGRGADGERVIKEIIKKYETAAGNASFAKEGYYSLEDMATMKGTKEDDRDANWYAGQVDMANNFFDIYKIAQDLGMVVGATRCDTSGGAAGPTIADSEVKNQKVLDLVEHMQKQKEGKGAFSIKFDRSPIGDFTAKANFSDFVESYIDRGYSKEDAIEEAISKMREYFLNSPMPYMEAFYTLGINSIEYLMKDYFIQYAPAVREVINQFKNMTKNKRLNADLLNSIYDDLFVYLMSSIDAFSTRGMMLEEGDDSAAQNRYDFIHTFPAYLEALKESDPEIAENNFIKRIQSRVDKKTGLKVLTFKAVGSLNAELKEQYSRDWASLLYSSNPKAQELALNLFRYNVYRNGFTFGPNTFNHLAPMALRTAFPGYKEMLNELLENKAEGLDLNSFVYQYCLNHLDTRALIPEATIDESVYLSGDKPVPEFSITFDCSDVRDGAFEANNNKTFGAVKEIIHLPNNAGIVVEVNKFIAVKHKGKMVYYVADDTIGKTIIYREVQPLGAKDRFIEYEYGKDAFLINSAVPKTEDDTIEESKYDEGDYSATKAMMPTYVAAINSPEFAEYYKETFNSSLDDLEKDVESGKIRILKYSDSSMDFIDEEGNKLCVVGKSI